MKKKNNYVHIIHLYLSIYHVG